MQTCSGMGAPEANVRITLSLVQIFDLYRESGRLNRREPSWSWNAIRQASILGPGEPWHASSLPDKLLRFPISANSNKAPNNDSLLNLSRQSPTF